MKAAKAGCGGDEDRGKERRRGDRGVLPSCVGVFRVGRGVSVKSGKFCKTIKTNKSGKIGMTCKISKSGKSGLLKTPQETAWSPTLHPQGVHPVGAERWPFGGDMGVPSAGGQL